MSEILQLKTLVTAHEFGSIENIEAKVFKVIQNSYSGSKVYLADSSLGFEVAVKHSIHPDGINHEWLGLLAAVSEDIPTQTPVALAEHNDDRVLVTKLIEGRNLSTFIENDSKFKIQNKLGKIVRKMHTNVKLAEDNVNIRPFEYYDKLLARWKTISLFNNDISHLIINSLANNMKEDSQGKKPVFTHHDIHDGQVFVSNPPNDDSIRLIDFENWRADSYLSEIGMYLFHSVRLESADEGFKQFIDGYKAGEYLTESEKEIILFNLLFISMRAVAYFSEYQTNYLPTALTTHQNILRYINQEKLWK